MRGNQVGAESTFAYMNAVGFFFSEEQFLQEKKTWRNIFIKHAGNQICLQFMNLKYQSFHERL